MLIKLSENLSQLKQQLNAERSFIKENYDIELIEDWIKEVKEVQDETLQIISNKIKSRFNVIKIPRRA